MKHLYLSITLFFISLISVAQNVTIPDPVFKQRLITLGVDTNGDNQIQETEALATTNLFAASTNGVANYTNIEGIQAFTNLDTLDISFNEIISLDVSGLTNLKYLKAVANDITTVNLTGLNDLTYLSLQSNELNSIDLSSTNNLEKLFISYNDLNAVDVAQLTNLTGLAVSSNNINTLDVSNLTQLKELICDANNINVLDVALLTNLSLIECANNNITNLDVSNHPLLEYINADNNDLVNLDCSNTIARYATAENNVNLVSYNINNGVISDSDPDLLDFSIRLANTPSLTTVCIDNNVTEIESLSISGYNNNSVSVFTGTNCSQPLGTKSNKFTNITIFPNPVDDVITITNRDIISNFSIIDITGKVVTTTPFYETLQNSVLNLKTGVYFLKMVTQTNATQTLKLIKK